MTIFISYLVARAFLAVILITSGSAKLADSGSFASTLMSLGVATRQKKVALGLAITLSLLELLIGGCIFGGFLPVVVNAVLLGMMCCFSITVLFAIYKAPQTNCRCFGALSNSQFSKHGLVRNIVFTLIALFVFISSLHFQSLQAHEMQWVNIFLVIGYAIFALGVAQAAKTEYQTKEETAA